MYMYGNMHCEESHNSCMGTSVTCMQRSDEAMYVQLLHIHTMHSDERVRQAPRNSTLTTEEVYSSIRCLPPLMLSENDIWATYTATYHKRVTHIKQPIHIIVYIYKLIDKTFHTKMYAYHNHVKTESIHRTMVQVSVMFKLTSLRANGKEKKGRYIQIPVLIHVICMDTTNEVARDAAIGEG